VGAIKNEDVSLTVEDNDGHETVTDLADDSANPFEMLAARQLDAALTCGIAELSDSHKAGLKAQLSDETMASNDRVYALRAREALAESLSASHFPLKSEKKAKKAKSPKAPKVEVVEEVEVPALAKLRTLATWEYQARTMSLTF
jgi:hypothetical protein